MVPTAISNTNTDTTWIFYGPFSLSVHLTSHRTSQTAGTENSGIGRHFLLENQGQYDLHDLALMHVLTR